MYMKKGHKGGGPNLAAVDKQERHEPCGQIAATPARGQSPSRIMTLLTGFVGG